MIRPALLPLLLFALAAQAVEPKAVVSGPQQVPAGVGVVLSADGSAHDSINPAWRIGSSPGYILGDQLIFLTTTPGQYQFDLLVGGIVEGKVKFATTSHTVTIGNAPNPGPQPTPPQPTPPVPPQPVPPTPVPTPDLPDGRYKLARVAYDAGMALPANAKAICPALGANFDAVASAAAAGVLSTPAKMHDEVYAKNVATQGTLQATCKPLFAALQSSLSAAASAGTLKTVPDHIEAWREIATGLKGVK